jgi:hypothetical protein
MRLFRTSRLVSACRHLLVRRPQLAVLTTMTKATSTAQIVAST